MHSRIGRSYSKSYSNDHMVAHKKQPINSPINNDIQNHYNTPQQSESCYNMASKQYWYSTPLHTPRLIIDTTNSTVHYNTDTVPVKPPTQLNERSSSANSVHELRYQHQQQYQQQRRKSADCSPAITNNKYTKVRRRQHGNNTDIGCSELESQCKRSASPANVVNHITDDKHYNNTPSNCNTVDPPPVAHANECIDPNDNNLSFDTYNDSKSVRSAIVSVVGCMLQQLFGNGLNDELPSDPSQITVFHTAECPAISIEAYFHRIAKYTDCSNEVLIMSLMHLNRLLHTQRNIQINNLNIHRLVLTSVLTTAKYFDDSYFNNAYYAKVGGISLKELNWLEIEFLSLINFDLYFSGELYQQFYHELIHPSLHTTCQCRYTDAPTVTTRTDIRFQTANPDVCNNRSQTCIKPSQHQLDHITNLTITA